MSVPAYPVESQQPLMEKKPYINNATTTTTSPSTTTGSSGHNGNSGHGKANGHSGNAYSPGRGSLGGDGDEYDSNHLKLLESESNITNQQRALQARVEKLRARLYVLGGITIVGFVILIVLCAVFFCKLNYDVAHHTHKPKLGTQMAAILEEGVCVSCEDFRVGTTPEEEYMLERYKDESSGGTIRCCVDQPAELLDLLKMFIERRFRQELSKGTVGNQLPQASKESAVVGPRPAAHLLYTRQDPSSIKHVPGRQQMIGRWLHDKDIAFVTGGAQYSKGRLVVPQDGYYFVYSQISFMEMFNGQQNTASPSLSVYLYRYNILYESGDGEEKLAQNSITKCWGQSKAYGEYTNTLGAVFSLRRQDHLFIKVSNISMVDPEPKRSYFGLFKI